MSEEPTPDQQADLVAAGQWGAISRRQAFEAGLSAKQIDGRRAARRWLSPIRGVYVVAGAPRSWQQDVIVPYLAAPEGTVVSHLTAGALLGLADPPALPHLTVPPGASGRFRNAVVHRSRIALGPRDRLEIGPVGVTSPARTLVDCAGLLGYEGLCEMLDRALCFGHATTAGVVAAVERASRAPGRKGLPLLHRALEAWLAGSRPESPAEMRLFRLLVAWGLPTPERQIRVFGRDGRFVARIDAGWSEPKIGLEYDGAEFHTPRQAGADADRQRRLEALGWRILRVRRADVRPPARQLRSRMEALLAGRRAA